MPLPARLQRRHVDDDPAARIGRFAEADDQHVARHPEIFDRPRQGEAVGRDDADVGLAIDEAVRRKVLGIDQRIVEIGEDLEFVGDARVVAIRGQAVADAAFAALALDERLDHVLAQRGFANPAIGQDGHGGSPSRRLFAGSAGEGKAGVARASRIASRGCGR